MGIQRTVAAFVAALPLPAGFSVCELGDQEMCGAEKGVSSRGWYASLGCGRYVSIDGNGRATITADLNRPVTLDERFDLVTDFGTGEHIFDQAQVWRTLHDLVKRGGLIAFDRPAQGYDKHCFYLANECLFRDLAAANHYEVLRLERAEMARGELIRGVFRRPLIERPFQVPHHGRYQDALVIA